MSTTGVTTTTLSPTLRRAREARVAALAAELARAQRELEVLTSQENAVWAGRGRASAA